MLAAFITAAICVITDLITKLMAVRFLYPDGSVAVVEGVLHFTYVENPGMAFGMLSERREIFLFASVVMLIALTAFLFYFRKEANLWLKLACGLVIGGGIGNMIDRVRLGYVVDFIDFCLFDFWVWVFNVADAAVCVGVFMLSLYLIADSVKLSREKKRAALESEAEEETHEEAADEDDHE